MQNIDKGLSYLLKACAILESKEEDDDTFLAELYFTIGEIYHETEKYQKSNNMLEKAIHLNENNQEQNKSQLMSAYQYMGSNYQILYEYGQAIHYFKKSCLILEEDNLKNPILKGLIIHTIGNVYFMQSEYINALKSYKEALLTIKDHVTDSDPKLLDIIVDFKKTYMYLEKTKDTAGVKSYKKFFEDHFPNHLPIYSIRI